MRARGRGAGTGGAAAGEVLLAWARDRDGAKVSATRLDARDRRARAPFTCLGCGEELVPHLGPVRAPHFAHRPGSRCPLAAPETALHLDVKERLLALCEDAFSGRRRVTLLARCSRCRRATPVDLAAHGDAAAPEAPVGALRADVLVRSRGAPALAFEVLVTHAVGAEKEAAFAEAGVPFAEIDASAEWERADGGGAIEIAPARCGGFLPCPACDALARAEADRALGGEAARIAELEAYRARGLFGPAARAGRRAGARDAPLSAAERALLDRRFRCPSCGSPRLEAGERLVAHACGAAPDAPPRPVAWRGYDGALVELSWWREERGPRRSATAGGTAGFRRGGGAAARLRTPARRVK